MDKNLMQSHIDANTYSDINPVLNDDNSNLSAFFCADVVGAKRFVINRGGYPMSEIAQINAATDMNMQINLLSQLEDYSPTDNPNAGLSDAEIMLGHRSKYCQTASEQIGWLQEQYNLRQSQRLASQKPEQKSEQTINFDGDENTES